MKTISNKFTRVNLFFAEQVEFLSGMYVRVHILYAYEDNDRKKSGGKTRDCRYT
jgi:hypothetical protein